MNREETRFTKTIGLVQIIACVHSTIISWVKTTTHIRSVAYVLSLGSTYLYIIMCTYMSVFQEHNMTQNQLLLTSSISMNSFL